MVFHVTVTSGHEEILEKLAAIRPEGGSFRITELNEVLIKVTAPGETIPEIPKFVTVLNNPLTFDNVENVPNDLSPGPLGRYLRRNKIFLCSYVYWRTEYLVEYCRRLFC